MLLYGLKSKIRVNFNRNKRKYKYSIIRRNNLDNVFSKSNKNRFKYIVSVPLNWKIYVIYNKLFNMYVILLVSPLYYYKFAVLNTFSYCLVDENSHSIVIYSLFSNTYSKLFLNFVSNVLLSVNTPNFLKVTFRGKGYYLYKNKRNTITPQFNYSHRLYLYTYFISVKFLNKTTVLFYSYNNSDVLLQSQKARNMRKINIFTGRGVRFAKQIIYRKTGKVSSYR
uniref:Ribosomal protein L6 n=1 Tax=Strombidium cf. sulcatum TaxID=2793073 RepID=A0A7T0Q603_9SPIT|nr:ribosomal protein L6 [Strombidium cf. sulcatum]QPL15939.1 ribosomal protein L6 [Strombidium cf. sulcatum]